MQGGQRGLCSDIVTLDHDPFACRAYVHAYVQGFASGDCERDGAAIQRFLSKGIPMALSQSYAKNMGMYGQRTGAFSIVCDNEKEAAAVESQVKAVARAMYSNPPCHGAYLVHEILSDPQLKAQWCASHTMNVRDCSSSLACHKCSAVFCQVTCRLP